MKCSILKIAARTALTVRVVKHKKTVVSVNITKNAVITIEECHTKLRSKGC